MILINEYELLYLFQEGHNNKAIINLYKLYAPFLEEVKRRTFYKYFALPIELSDLESLKYFSVLESAKMYNPQSRKKLKDFIFQRYTWDIHKQIRQCLNMKNRVLNYYVKLANDNVTSDEEYFSSKLARFDEQKQVIKLFYQQLSPLEKEVFRLWYAGENIYNIHQLLALDYRQVDNAMQRIMQKTKNFYKNN
ncbi:hypothetical protein S100390_v1c01550 [Spiroplasma sp. NBRC 100390]|uniref:RNA polymerase subunit sigma n=2 Tax=Spiroplasma TaxID=2132 RepID=UPI00089281AE|nr:MULTISPECIES: RNA polymerase subunit sigma [unclassified Spiroplasma]AOX43498.1 hypothetical protein STU14_v1c01550 [Spiroplasma sp. TU-14]APE12968.1 hypothetical protein S100390_v1c01550 [Spiroplasma sp. NBRC 100390]